jgi:hypothetical protein
MEGLQEKHVVKAGFEPNLILEPTHLLILYWKYPKTLVSNLILSLAKLSEDTCWKEKFFLMTVLIFTKQLFEDILWINFQSFCGLMYALPVHFGKDKCASAWNKGCGWERRICNQKWESGISVMCPRLGKLIPDAISSSKTWVHVTLQVND